MTITGPLFKWFGSKWMSSRLYPKPDTDIRTLGLSEGQTILLKTWQRTNNVGNCWTISPWGNDNRLQTTLNWLRPFSVCEVK